MNVCATFSEKPIGCESVRECVSERERGNLKWDVRREEGKENCKREKREEKRLPRKKEKGEEKEMGQRHTCKMGGSKYYKRKSHIKLTSLSLAVFTI